MNLQYTVHLPHSSDTHLRRFVTSHLKELIEVDVYYRRGKTVFLSGYP